MHSFKAVVTNMFDYIIFCCFMCFQHMGRAQLASIELRDDLIELYDQDNFQSNFFHTGGHVIIYCEANCTSSSDSIELISPNTSTVDTQKCDQSQQQIFKFRLVINKATQYGKYFCRYPAQKITSSKSLTLPYRLCAEGGRECIKEEHCTDSGMCFVTANETVSCALEGSYSFSDWFPNNPAGLKIIPNSRMCPIGGQTFFISFLQSYSQVWAEMDGNCPSGTQEIPRIIYKGRYYLYNEPILIDLNHKDITAMVENPPPAEAPSVACLVKVRGGKILQEFGDDEQWATTTQLSDSLFSNGSQIFTFECRFNKSAGEATVGRIAEHGKDKNNFKCELSKPVSNRFLVEYAWVGGSGENGASLDLSEAVHIRCKATIMYRSCTPHSRLFTYTAYSDYIKVDVGGAEMVTVTKIVTITKIVNVTDTMTVTEIVTATVPPISTSIRTSISTNSAEENLASSMIRRYGIFCILSAFWKCFAIDSALLID